MTGNASLEARERIEKVLQAVATAVQRELPPHPPLERTPEDQYRHLLEEAQELYENELLWDEEGAGGGPVEAADLVFPGTLALVGALATAHTPGERGEGAPHRDVIFAFLRWLGDRARSLRVRPPGDRTVARRRIELTDRLIRLVGYRYFGLTADEVERVEADRGDRTEPLEGQELDSI